MRATRGGALDRFGVELALGQHQRERLDFLASVEEVAFAVVCEER
jgi:hypothetical protein